MPTALFLSPHLDDAVFSCGGLAITLADAGWETMLVTAFTRSVVPATGFALACQLDKGLPPHADYMALRRAEDMVAGERAGFDAVLWLDLLEAPHRGYDSAPALFAGVRPGDDPGLLPMLNHLQARHVPDLVLAPQGLGNHADHLVMIAAVQQAFAADRTLFYRDTPYAIRQPAAQPAPSLASLPSHAADIGPALGRKIDAALAYTTQVPFQFGSPAAAAAALRGFAMQEGGDAAAECFLGVAWPASLPAKQRGHATRKP